MCAQAAPNVALPRSANGGHVSPAPINRSYTAAERGPSPAIRGNRERLERRAPVEHVVGDVRLRSSITARAGRGAAPPRGVRCAVEHGQGVHGGLEHDRQPCDPRPAGPRGAGRASALDTPCACRRRLHTSAPTPGTSGRGSVVLAAPAVALVMMWCRHDVLLEVVEQEQLHFPAAVRCRRMSVGRH